MKFLSGLLLAASLLAQDSIPRPKILGIAHIALYVEPSPDGDCLNHIAICTGDAVRMRDYLASCGVPVPG